MEGGWRGGWREEGREPGSGSPVFQSVLMTQMCSCRDGCLGNCKSPAPGGPSLGGGEAGRKELEREKERGRE